MFPGSIGSAPAATRTSTIFQEATGTVEGLLRRRPGTLIGATRPWRIAEMEGAVLIARYGRDRADLPAFEACPLLDENLGLCRGHDSFYWRYFNCGRFPSVSAELDYYNCHKWVLSKRDSTRVQASPVFSAALINVIEKRSGTERVSLEKPR